MGSPVKITKVDSEKRMVFGFFSINKVGESLVEDLQGDLIETEELEEAAYDFVLEARIAGTGHTIVGVGHLVESVMLTYEKQQAIQDCLTSMGITATVSLGCEGWFGGFKIHDETLWEAIKQGNYPAFSIGGSGIREPITNL